MAPSRSPPLRPGENPSSLLSGWRIGLGRWWILKLIAVCLRRRVLAARCSRVRSKLLPLLLTCAGVLSIRGSAPSSLGERGMGSPLR